MWGQLGSGVPIGGHLGNQSQLPEECKVNDEKKNGTKVLARTPNKQPNPPFPSLLQPVSEKSKIPHNFNHQNRPNMEDFDDETQYIPSPRK